MTLERFSNNHISGIQTFAERYTGSGGTYEENEESYSTFKVGDSPTWDFLGPVAARTGLGARWRTNMIEGNVLSIIYYYKHDIIYSRYALILTALIFTICPYFYRFWISEK